MNEPMSKSIHWSRGSLGLNSKMSYSNYNKDDIKKENILPFVSKFF